MSIIAKTKTKKCPTAWGSTLVFTILVANHSFMHPRGCTGPCGFTLFAISPDLHGACFRGSPVGRHREDIGYGVCGLYKREWKTHPEDSTQHRANSSLQSFIFPIFSHLLLEASHSLVEPNVTLFTQQLSSFFSPNYSNHQHEGLRRCFHHRFRRCRLGRPSQVRSHELLQHVQAC